MAQPDEPEADGYYGDEAVNAQELDLSFLDDEESGKESSSKS